jgi:MFS family permease
MSIKPFVRSSIPLNTPFKHSIYVAVLAAIAGMSDAFLYAYLPIHASSLGFSATMVGVLLSVNRFIRFFSNRFMAVIAKLIGIKKVFVVGIILSILSTLMYAMSLPFEWWLLSRALWGVAFSTLRFSSMQYSIACEQQMGQSLGVNSSVHAISQMIPYVLGPFLMVAWSSSFTFIFFGLLLLVSLPLLLFLPDVSFEPQNIKSFSFERPSRLDLFAFIISLGVDGILVVGLLHILPSGQSTEGILISVGILLGIRRVITIVIAPISGFLIGKCSFGTLMLGAGAIVVVGFILLMSPFKIIALVCLYIGATFFNTFLPVVAIASCDAHSTFSTITRLNTSRDMGSALGALGGLSLIQSLPQEHLFVILGTLVLLTALRLYLYVKRNAFQQPGQEFNKSIV